MHPLQPHYQSFMYSQTQILSGSVHFSASYTSRIRLILYGAVKLGAAD